MILIKSISRMYPIETIEEWKIGEGDYLRLILGVGFYNTIFIKEGDWINFYYNYSEVKEFEKALEEQIGEDEFNNLCDIFMELINKSDVKIRELVPYLTIFNEFDEYPEYMEGDMAKRLLRVRTSTESKVYDLMKGTNKLEQEQAIEKEKIIEKEMKK